MFGDLGAEWIEQLLKNQIFGRIGCHADDRIYIVPICYAYAENCIYARTFEGLKLKMMRENPKVCFQLENLESMGKWQSVICWGEFEELTGTIERKKGIEILKNRISAKMEDKSLRLSHHWPFSLDESDIIDGIIFRICLREKTGKYEKI